MSSLNYLTWNVRGLNDHRKSRLVHSYLVRKAVDICLLQETHLTPTTSNRLCSARWSCIYSATYSNYSRGVAILIKKGLPWTLLKTVSDPEGRYVLVLGTLYNKPLLIVNSYAPNVDDVSFFPKLWHAIQLMGAVDLIWGGDFNTVLSLTMDRVGLSRTHHPLAADALRTIIHDNRLVDTWRRLHPTVKEGTCITQHHNAWSRLDFWLLSPMAHAHVQSVSHLPCTLSDHSPVLMAVTVPLPYRQPFKWRLPYNSLFDPVFNEEIRNHITEYFAFNTGTVTSCITLWDAFKSVIRGHCIAGQTRVLKDIRNRLQSLETELHTLETQYYATASTTLFTAIRTKLTDYQEEAQRETQFLCKHAQARSYGERDRPSKTLAYLLRPPRGTNHITELHTPDGGVFHSPADILAVVRNYYAELYTS